MLLRKLINIYFIFLIGLLPLGCGDELSPEQFAYTVVSPITVKKYGLEVTLQKHDIFLELEHKLGKDFYTKNNGFLLEVKNTSKVSIKVTPYIESFIEDNYGKKYMITEWINVDDSDATAAGILGGAIGGGIAGGVKYVNLDSKLFREAELAPGESKKGILLFEKLKENTYRVKIIIPKMLNGQAGEKGAFIWGYTVKLLEK